MNLSLLIYPVASVVALHFLVGFWMIFLRFHAVMNKELNIKYFQLNQGQTPPLYLAKVNNNYNNLFQVPVLFYLVVTFVLLTNQVEPAQVILAWLFALSRFIHSAIHTTYNNIIHRMWVFLFGALTTLVMWVLLLIRLVT